MKNQKERRGMRSRSISKIRRQPSCNPLVNKTTALEIDTDTNSFVDTTKMLVFNTDAKADRKAIPSALIKYYDMLSIMEQKVMNYIYMKRSRYKNLRNDVVSFFQSEIAELNNMAEEWESKIASVKKLICDSKFNDRSKITVEILPHIGSLAKAGTRGSENETVIQRLESEINLLNAYAQKMSNFENSRDDVISDIVKRLVSLRETHQRGQKPEVEVIEVLPVKPRQIMLKLDLRVLNDVFVLDVLDSTRKRCHFENVRLCPDSASIFLAGKFFVCGGRSETERVQYKHTFQLDFGILKLVKRANMRQEKRNHSLASVSPKCFYSIGGFNEKAGYLATCEKYLVDTDNWVLMPSIKEARQDPTPCSVGGRYIYLFGGAAFSGGEWQYSLTIEYLDTHNETVGWRRVPYKYVQAWYPKVYVGAVQVKEYQILLFGGYNGMHSDKCFEYNLAENSVEAINAKLPVPSSFISRNAAPMLCDSNVYAVAANSYDLFSYSVETRTWRLASKWKQHPMSSIMSFIFTFA